MTVQAVFETATLADAVARSSRIAPTKGTAFDKAAGLVIEMNPQKPSVAVVKSTNMEVSWREEITVLEMGDEPARWRIPAQTFSAVMATLPIGSDKRTTLSEDEGRRLLLRAGKKRMKIAMAPMDTYPAWEAFSADGMATVDDLGSRIKQAAWAVGDTPPWSGVHIDGERLVSTDKYKAVIVPCVVPVDEPITVPAAILGPVLKDATDMRIRVQGRQLLLMPDDYTQIRTSIFDVEYPDRTKLNAMLRTDKNITFDVERQGFIEAIQNMVVLVKSERLPNLRMEFDTGAVTFYVTDGETAEMHDVLEIDYDDEPFTLNVTPGYVVQALNNATGPRVTIGLGPTPHSTIYLSDSDGYESWIMPRRLD